MIIITGFDGNKSHALGNPSLVKPFLDHHIDFSLHSPTVQLSNRSTVKLCNCATAQLYNYTILQLTNKLTV